MNNIYVFNIEENKETYFSFCNVFMDPNRNIIIVKDEDFKEFIELHSDYKLLNHGNI